MATTFYRKKNTATKVTVCLRDATTGLPKTGVAALDTEYGLFNDATAQTTWTDCTNEMTEIGSTGHYTLAILAGEVNDDYSNFQTKGTGIITENFTIDTLHAPTSDSSGRVDIGLLLGTAWLTPGTAGTPDVNAKLLGGTSQTGRDVGASVLLSSGSGTGQLDFTGGVVKANLAQILGTALTETAGLLAGGFKKFFNVASPTGTLNSIPDAVPDASGGLPVTGTRLTAIPTLPAALVGGRVDANVGAMAANVLTATAINADAITAAKVADGTIDAATFAAGAINAAAIASGALTAAKFASDYFTNTAAGIWDYLTSAASVVGSFGKLLKDNVDTVLSTIYSRLGAPAGASMSADIAAVKVDTAAVKVQTDKLTFTVANQIDSNVIDWKGATAPAMTGDAYARLGAPTAASVSADILAVKGDTAAVKLKTDNLPSDPADASDVAGQISSAQTAILAKLPAALVSGRMDSSVGAMATDTLTAAALATDAVTEMQSGLSTLTQANVRSAMGLASANLDIQFAAIPAAVDAVLPELANLDTTVSSRLPTSSYTAPLSAAGTRSAVGLASANLDTQLDALPTAAENAAANWAVTGSELSAAPTASSSVKDQLQLLFQDRVHAWDQTATRRRRFKANGSTVLTTETLSNDGTTVTKSGAS